MNNHEEHGVDEDVINNTIEQWRQSIGNIQNIFNTKLNNLRNALYKINKLKKQHLEDEIMKRQLEMKEKQLYEYFSLSTCFFSDKLADIKLKTKKKLYQLLNNQELLSMYHEQIKNTMFSLLTNQNNLDMIETLLNSFLRDINVNLQLPDLDNEYQPSFFRKLYIDSTLSKVKHNLVKTHKKLIDLNNELENIERANGMIL